MTSINLISIPKEHLIGIPEDMQQELQEYYRHGLKPCQFISYLLENNFILAFKTAGKANLGNLASYASLIYNFLPVGSWGNRLTVDTWISQGGMHAKR